MKKILFIAVLSAITTACSNKKETENLDKAEVQTTEVTADPNEMLGKQWRLRELNGKPIVLDSTFEKYSYIKFNDINSASGNLGCNGFGAKVEFTGSNSIKISEITSTEMACGNLEIETKFNEALQNTTNYIVSENKLYLNNNQNTTVATLEIDAN